MSNFSDAVLGGLTLGLYNTANILTSGLTSYGMYRSGVDPFNTLFVDLDSSSGFSSCIHPSYASRYNVLANANGLDTTWSPLTSAVSTSIASLFTGGFCSGIGSSNVFGYGFPSSNIYINANTYTHLGKIPRFNGYFC